MALPFNKNNFEDNICFRSERVMYNIKLVGAIIAVFNEENEVDAHKMKFSVENVIVGPNMDDYYLYESKKVKNI